MLKFPSIESFRHVIRKISETGAYHGWTTMPVIKFTGTVKLHGTNCGVHRLPDGTLQAQSREREISYTSDNAGFAAFVLTQNDALQALFAKHFESTDDAFIFGEWCGRGIQKGMGINQLDKHFVIFAAVKITEDKPEGDWMNKDVLKDIHDNEHGIWNIHQIPEYEIVVDFNKPDDFTDQLTELTLAVEDVCPWATFRGVTEAPTLGEGIVWVSEPFGENKVVYSFKTKGLKHKRGGKEGSAKVGIAPEKLESIQALVEAVLPEWRLEQGVATLKERGVAIAPETTGEYIKWISQDILKEEADVVAASGLEWKAVAGPISRVAKDFWFKVMDEA